MGIRKNLPLYIALAIPVVMILAVALSIYLPGLGKQPAHNFLYMTQTNAYAYPGVEYSIDQGHLVHNDYSSSTPPGYPSYPEKITAGDTHFYVYNVVENSASEINFTDAQKFKLDQSNISPDGYVVERGTGNSFPFGGNSDYNSWFIKGFNRSTKLNIKYIGTDYYNFQFLGWIE